MYDNQHGFRKEHYTECAALEIIHRILTHTDNKEIPILQELKLYHTFLHNKLPVYLLNLLTNFVTWFRKFDQTLISEYIY